MLDRVQLKQEARAILGRSAVSPWLFTLMLMGILAGLNSLDALVSGSYAETLQLYLPEEMIPQELLRTQAVPAAVSTFVGVLVTLLGTVLRAGNNRYHLGVRDGQIMPYSTVWSCFTFAGRVILLSVVQTALILLGLALLIIPGVIAAYCYRFAVLNLLENPNIGVFEAMAMSRRQTAGFKMDLFVLDLSFLGWLILCGLTFGVLYVWIGPYISQTNVGAFRFVKRASGAGTFFEDPDGGASDPSA